MSIRSVFSGVPAGGLSALAVAGVCGLAASSADAQLDPPVMLQWFEQEWDDMERRVPDFFLSGYGAVWLPPPSITSDPSSPGFDVFDQFNLGEPGNETLYGTEDDFRAMVDELKRANGRVYVDTVLNHRSGRRTDKSFYLSGGYPGFWAGPVPTGDFKQPTDNWGDFHGGNNLGYFQSQDPGGTNYDRVVGDLVALVDINHGTNNQFIRQPIGPDAMNIPPGSFYNLPDPSNVRFYPDRDLAPTIITQAENNRLGPGQTLEVYPYNIDVTQGDAVPENATGYLMRWAQWMLEVQKIDGFRLDAAKHAAEFFWDQYYDSAVYNRWTTPDGRQETPFSFGESTLGNSFLLSNYVRIDSFAKRDTLDLTGAGSLRNLKSGLGNWSTAVFDPNSGHIDNADDGFNNGSVGVMHVFSHDNGTQGDGNSQPILPNSRDQAYPMTAYLLMRTGHQIVYYNARGVSRPFGFWPREGYPASLGWDPVAGQLDSTITDLVKLRNEYGRGFFIPLNGNYTDQLVFSRRTPTGGDNVLVGVSDRYDGGFDSVTVNTEYPQGTRLHELTGNAADPAVDPGNNIPETIIVGANGQVTINVPRNDPHNKGYVVYGEAVPGVSVQIANASGTIAGDPATFSPAKRRIADVPIVTDDTLTLRAETSVTDPGDPNTDDNAIFRINAGYVDYNQNGSVDFAFDDNFFPGFEAFTSTNSPRFGGGSGVYEQVIDTTQMEEGYHYAVVNAFRHRDAQQNAWPIFGEGRLVFYVDRECPDVDLVGGDQVLAEAPTDPLQVVANDRTTNRVHVFNNLPEGLDPLSILTPLNQAQRVDRFRWQSTAAGLVDGVNTITVVAVEDSGRTCITEYTYTIGDQSCEPDITTTNTNPGDAGYGEPDGTVDGADLSYFVEQWLTINASVADVTTTNTNPGDAGYGQPDGSVDGADLSYFVEQWLAGCL